MQCFHCEYNFIFDGFKDPEPPASWTGLRDARNIKVNCCVQPDELSRTDIIGSEDSLYLNVYTSSLTGSKAVMVYIHGGGFTSGSGTEQVVRPDYFMNKDIVLVTTNYRLGVLGEAHSYKYLSIFYQKTIGMERSFER